MMYVALFLLLGASRAASAELAPPPLELERVTPRPFGYLIGDRIEHQIYLRLPGRCRLEPAALPAGQLNHWLEAQVGAIAEHRDADSVRYRLRLVYQTYAGVLEVKTLKVPALTLRYRCGETAGEAVVPPWAFTQSPLQELALRRAASSEYLQPDHAAQRLDATSARRRSWGFGMSLVALVAVWLGLEGRRLYRARPFAGAYRTVHTLLAQSGGGGEPARAAFLCLHRAFDAYHGQPMFAAELEAFCGRAEGFRRLQPEIEAFFAASDRVFFAGELPERAFPSERLSALCLALRNAEREA